MYLRYRPLPPLVSLSLLQEEDANVSSLAEGVDGDEPAIRERLPKLADNGLVLPVRDDVYTTTGDGEQTDERRGIWEYQQSVERPVSSGSGGPDDG